MQQADRADRGLHEWAAEQGGMRVPQAPAAQQHCSHHMSDQADFTSRQELQRQVGYWKEIAWHYKINALFRFLISLAANVFLYLNKYF